MSSITGVGPKSIAKSFKDANIPAGYVAGIGRGAMGFTTRSDLGPSKPSVPGLPNTISIVSEPNFGQAPAGYVAGRGRGMGDLAKQQAAATTQSDGSLGVTTVDDDNRFNTSDSHFDKNLGYEDERGIFAMQNNDEEDIEADMIYSMVDEYMENRHKRKLEQTLLSNNSTANITGNNRPKISEQFADLKRELSTVSAEQWESIPEIGDYSLKYKQSNKKESTGYTPDFIIQDNANRVSNSVSGTSTVNIATGLSDARGTVLSLKLDKMSDSVSGQTVVDPKGYLTDLSSIQITSNAGMGDINKARTLLQSVITINPRHAPGWIAAARVEREAGKLVQARKILKQACDSCPESEDVWLEAAAYSTPENSKIILASAVRAIPASVKIWLKAAELETLVAQKKIVLRKALEIMPNSVKLWKEAILLEEDDDARVMLARAVECVPHSVDMWLALAKLETHDNARKVLNQARGHNPSEYIIWITAAKLEEVNGCNLNMIELIIEKMMQSLSQYQVVIDRDAWIKEANACEDAACILTCKALVNNTIFLGIDDEDRINTWMDDAENCINSSPKKYIETARAIYNYALKIFPTKKTIWIALGFLEKEHGTSDSLDTVLKDGVKNCPKAETLWLMAAKEKWTQGNIPAARSILKDAYDHNSDNVDIFLAAIKLEWEINEFQHARVLLSKAREKASCEKVWMKSALLEIEVGDYKVALQLLEQGIKLFPTFDRLYLICCQIYTNHLNDVEKAKEYCNKGLKNCPLSVPIWKLLVYIEVAQNNLIKARSLLETARLKLPNSDEIWLETIRLERLSGASEKIIDLLLSKALQACPNSGIIWADDLIQCPKHQQKSKSIEAMKRCENNPYVMLSVARIFDRDGKIDKARKWFEKCVTIDPKIGDSYAYWYCCLLKLKSTHSELFEQKHIDSIIETCVAAKPNKGELWCTTKKQTENRRLSCDMILKKIVKQILKTT